MRISNKSLLALAVSSLLVAPSVQATNGYFSDGYGAKSRGMGGSGVAIAQETGSILQNPAAAVGIGQRYDAAIGYFSPHPRSVTIENNDIGLNTAGPNVSGRNDFFIPFYGQSFEINDSSSWAVTLSALGGMNTDYASHPFAALGATGNMGIDLKQAQIAGTYAIELSKGLSVGASLGFVIQQFQAHGLLPFASLSADSTRLSDNGKSMSTGIGMNLGVMYDMGNGISFGAQYAPATDMSEFDEYSGLFAENGDFDIPSHYSVGIAWQASSSVLVAFDYRHINYTDVASISNDAQRLTDFPASTDSTTFSCGAARGASLANPSSEARCLGGANGGGFGWSDQDVYKIGMAIDQGNGVTYRIGWNHGDSPIEAEDAVINIIAPATTEDHLTLGFTKTLDANSEVTIDFIRSFENSITGDVPAAFSQQSPSFVPPTGNPAGTPGASTISMAQKFLEINYARRF